MWVLCLQWLPDKATSQAEGVQKFREQLETSRRTAVLRTRKEARGKEHWQGRLPGPAPPQRPRIPPPPITALPEEPRQQHLAIALPQLLGLRLEMTPAPRGSNFPTGHKGSPGQLCKEEKKNYKSCNRQTLTTAWGRRCQTPPGPFPFYPHDDPGRVTATPFYR